MSLHPPSLPKSTWWLVLLSVCANLFLGHLVKDVCMHRTRGHPVVLLDMLCISPSPCGAPPCNHALVPGLHYSRRHQLLIFTLPGVHASHSSRLPHPVSLPSAHLATPRHYSEHAAASPAIVNTINLWLSHVRIMSSQPVTAAWCQNGHHTLHNCIINYGTALEVCAVIVIQ